MEAARATSARAAEAAGEATVAFSFRGHTVTIARALEDWPLDDIRAEKYGRALVALIGADLIKAMKLRTRGDLIELSHRCADACGVTPLPEDPAEPGAFFGAVPTVLGVIDNYGDDLEADLLERYGVDYRQAPPGGPTLRQVWIMVRRIQADSAILAARNKGDKPWSRGDVLAAQQIEMWTRKRYHGRPPTRQEFDTWLAEQQKQSETMDKLDRRRQYYASGQNMRDAGVDPGQRQPAPPSQPPRTRETPAQHALAVAMKNARRTPRKAAPNGRPQPGSAGQPGPAGPRPYDPSGSGWG